MKLQTWLMTPSAKLVHFTLFIFGYFINNVPTLLTVWKNALQVQPPPIWLENSPRAYGGSCKMSRMKDRQVSLMFPSTAITIYEPSPYSIDDGYSYLWRWWLTINFPRVPSLPLSFIFLTTLGGMSREELLETNERLRAVRIRLEESYDTAKKALVTLMNKYGDSKSQRNVFNRYPMLKLMIKVIVAKT